LWARVSFALEVTSEQRTDRNIHTLNAGMDRDQILNDYRAWFNARAQAGGMANVTFDQYEAANPLYMSVDGIIRYWTKKARDTES
jgi:hypothetical protein